MSTDKKIKILVVEDVEIAQKIAIYILSKLNCVIDIANTGAKALGLIEQKSYQLIFMDLGLPDIDGLTVTEMIRIKETVNQHIPIIALTAHSDSEVKEKCFGVGMNDFLVKPLTPQSAAAILQKFLQLNSEIACKFGNI